MKKKLLIIFPAILIFGAFSNLVNAQTSANGKTVGYGIRAGVNFANLTNTNASRRVGFMAGLYGNFLISNSKVSFQPEIFYTQKGVKKDVQGTTGKIRLDYIEIPLLLKYNFMTKGPVIPGIYVGPYVGFNVKSDVAVSSANANGSVDIGDNTKSTDFGIVVGGSVGFGHINVGIRYGFGLVNVFKDESSDNKNSVLSLTAGFGF
jgi:hypothetical protein